MTMNEWTKVRIRQIYSEDVSWEGSGYIFDSGYLYEIQINNQTIFSEINTRPFTHDNVQVCRKRDEFCISTNKI